MSYIGATILGCEGLRLTSGKKTFFRNARPFGFILFARNIDTSEQIRALCDDLRSCVDHEAPILIDQEGGRVQRLRPPLATEWTPPLDFVTAAGRNAERAMYLRYLITALELRSVGIDANCAPMVDVACDVTHPFLKNRCYGSDVTHVSTLGRAVADGLADGGVLPVLKHIPGHGRAQADSHLDLPLVSANADELKRDFAPFRALNDLPMGMTAHLVYDALDAAPATTSPIVMQLIRDKIGFDGLIMTDDISMKALSGPLSQRSSASIDAGCDVVLHCNGDLQEMAEVVEAAGEMTQVAQVRAQAVLDARKIPVTLDISALTAELETLI
ncbi:beta-N-acetylhexosaminidase [Shimia gijangensis]|uniref:beta-N-acetylhexosaminidase n=1 Tax=Shimia gijangensis TaxID=1470563 RepID=UPI000932FAAB|nr:beta-N-acetylhexosaminidase [Shimia gijangensis]